MKPGMARSGFFKLLMRLPHLPFPLHLRQQGILMLCFQYLDLVNRSVRGESARTRQPEGED